jgi:hypothetical protein
MGQNEEACPKQISSRQGPGSASLPAQALLHLRVPGGLVLGTECLKRANRGDCGGRLVPLCQLYVPVKKKDVLKNILKKDILKPYFSHFD